MILLFTRPKSRLWSIDFKILLMINCQKNEALHMAWFSCNYLHSYLFCPDNTYQFSRWSKWPPQRRRLITIIFEVLTKFSFPTVPTFIFSSKISTLYALISLAVSCSFDSGHSSESILSSTSEIDCSNTHFWSCEYITMIFLNESLSISHHLIKNQSEFLFWNSVSVYYTTHWDLF